MLETVVYSYGMAIFAQAKSVASSCASLGVAYCGSVNGYCSFTPEVSVGLGGIRCKGRQLHIEEGTAVLRCCDCLPGSVCLSQELLPNLLQMVLFETAASSEKRLVGSRGGVAVVFCRRQLDATDVVGQLKEAIVLRGDIAIGGGILGKRIFDSIMRNATNAGLPEGDTGGNPPALGGRSLREDQSLYSARDLRGATGVSAVSETLLRQGAAFPHMGCGYRRALSCGEVSGSVIMTASGCPCCVLRAAPFMFRLTASYLMLAVSFRFGACSPHAIDGPDHRGRQSHHTCGKLQQLNNQVHGQFTSFRKRRRRPHTGLTPLTFRHYIINTRTSVP